MKILSLLFCVTASLAMICPLCPVIVGAAVQGGFLTKNPLLASSIAASATFPFLLAFIDGFRTRNMTFDYPNPETLYHAGKTYSLFMHTFGLASRMHLRTADIYLLNASFDKVALVASEKEFKVLHNLTRATLGMPQKGVGYLDFTLPSTIPSGIYYIKYVSGWSIWRHESRFESISSFFYIAGLEADSSCSAPKCLGLAPPTESPLIAYTAETAPLELQFMFPHTKHAVKNILNGVVDGVASVPRALINIDSNSLKHPIDALKNTSRDWDEGFERNPFKATGQAIGVGLSVGIPAQMLASTLQKKNKASSPIATCVGGACPLIAQDPQASTSQTHVFQVEGPHCSACTTAIKNHLSPHGSVKVSPVEGGNAFISLEKTSLGADKVVEMIEELGFAARHGRALEAVDLGI